MKICISFLILFLTVIQCFGQRNKVELSHYILPDFTNGTVIMKSGGKNVALLNYNSLTEEMIFDDKGKKLAIGPVEQIDTIIIEGRKFFPVQGKFVELLYHNEYELYAIHKCSVVEPGKPAAYGGTSQTSSTTSYSSIFAGGQAYELALPDGFTTKPYTDYYLKIDGKLNMFLSIRQLSKLFGDKSEQFKKYTKENKVNYEKQETLIALIKFMEEQ